MYTYAISDVASYRIQYQYQTVPICNGRKSKLPLEAEQIDNEFIHRPMSSRYPDAKPLFISFHATIILKLKIYFKPLNR